MIMSFVYTAHGICPLCTMYAHIQSHILFISIFHINAPWEGRGWWINYLILYYVMSMHILVRYFSNKFIFKPFYHLSILFLVQVNKLWGMFVYRLLQHNGRSTYTENVWQGILCARVQGNLLIRINFHQY
jgi:hypothetical protein